MPDQTLKEQLEERGWKLFYQCDCPSGRKEYFNHPDHANYAIRTKQRQQTFRVVLDNQVIAGPFWGYDLEAKLTKYVT